MRLSGGPPRMGPVSFRKATAGRPAEWEAAGLRWLSVDGGARVVRVEQALEDQLAGPAPAQLGHAVPVEIVLLEQRARGRTLGHFRAQAIGQVGLAGDAAAEHVPAHHPGQPARVGQHVQRVARVERPAQGQAVVHVLVDLRMELLQHRQRQLRQVAVVRLRRLTACATVSCASRKGRPFFTR